MFLIIFYQNIFDLVFHHLLYADITMLNAFLCYKLAQNFGREILYLNVLLVMLAFFLVFNIHNSLILLYYFYSLYYYLNVYINYDLLEIDKFDFLKLFSIDSKILY